MSQLDTAELEGLTLDQLRALWRAKLKLAPPAHASRDLLARALIHRLETRSSGASVRALRTKLVQLAEGFARDGNYTPPAVSRLRPGAVLVRDWNGKRFAVTVTEIGFLFDGRPYTSLSPIAATITGVKWSGPRFFKLNDLDESKAP
jgi:hypothetical protein